MIPFDELLKEQMSDPDFREDWERTALARAVANQVIRYRTRHGLSQSELGRRLGVSQAVVGRLELGEHEPKISTLSKLTRTLGLRFSIDIHPADQNTTQSNDDIVLERVASNGVELIVTGSESSPA